MEIMNHIEKQLVRSQQGWVDDLAWVLWVHRTLPRNSQNETLFTLTYGSEAISPTTESLILKNEESVTREKAKRKESKEREIASIEEAYYQNKLRKYHNTRSNHSTFKLGDFVLLSQSNKDSQQVWKGPHIISGVYDGELYKIKDASDYSLVQTAKGTSLPMWDKSISLRKPAFVCIAVDTSKETQLRRKDTIGRTIDQSAGGKLRDRNAKESWALLEDLALYDNESWNDPRDFAKLVKAITLPQDVLSTSDRRLIELENQVQRLMEAHLGPTQPTQVNKITTSCEICSGPHDTQYCMEDPEQAFVEYASSRTDKAGEGLVSNFMTSQDAILSKFEADFKQQQSEMTNKIDTVLKAITDRIAGALTVKNPKLSTSPVLSARSYPKIDSQCSYHPSTSINIKAHSKEANDLHLNLPVLEGLAHALIYNAMLDKYVESLELGKNGSAFVQGEVPAKMEDPGLFTLPCRLGDSKPFDTLADLGSCVNIIPLYLFKKLNIGLLEETDHIFGLADGTKSYPVGIVKDVEVHIGKLKLLNDF
ncbi:MAK10-like protein [Tanacetum coccineum]